VTEKTSQSARIISRLLSLPTLSLLIASLSLVSSISQSFNYRRNIETVQQNLLRGENLKTCREIIGVFFDFRLKAEEANARASAGGQNAAASADRRREMKAAVYRFGALGTYLANFTPDAARERYTALTWQLNDIADKAEGLAASDFEARFNAADKAFATLNEDCARLAQFVKF
jgi:hypothetical protein